MSSSTSWLSEQIRGLLPDDQLVNKAARHLSNFQRGSLYSDVPYLRAISRGALYEFVIYEMVVVLSEKYDSVRVLAKGRDVPFSMRAKPKLGQDGLFYNIQGDITVRGNGQDLCELDGIIATEGEGTFALEVKTSGKNLEDFDKDARYKTRLLAYLLGNPTRLLLVSPVEMDRRSMIKGLIRDGTIDFILSKPIGDIVDRSPLKGLESNALIRPGQRIVYPRDLKTRSALDYSRAHDELMRLISDSINGGISSTEFKHAVPAGTFVKNVLLGELDQGAIESFFETRKLEFDNSTVVSSVSAFQKHLSRLVFSISVENLRPIVYAKSMSMPMYHKLGPFSLSTFGRERGIVQGRTALYDWLEVATERISSDYLNRLLSVLLTRDTVGKRRKWGDTFKAF